MRILFVSHAYIEEVNRRKLELLAKEVNLEVGVVYPNKWRTWHGETKIQDSKFKNQDFWEFASATYWSGDAGRYLYHPIQLIVLVLKFLPDLIHVEEEPFTIVSFQIALISRLLGIKFSFFTWENIVTLKLGFWRSLVEKIVFSTALFSVAGTLGAKERLAKRGFKKAIGVVPQFGVDTARFFPEPGLPVGVAPEFLTVGFVGRPTLDKGLDTLLEALGRLEGGYRLLWATTSSVIPAEIRQIIEKLGLSDRVKIKTQIAHENLPEYYRQMDIYVLPSRTTASWKEQFGRTALEAMACGVPVIGSSSGAIPEVIGEVGLIFEEGNVRDLAAKIRILSDPSVRHRLAAAGLDYVGQKYSAEKVTEGLSKFFQAQCK